MLDLGKLTLSIIASLLEMIEVLGVNQSWVKLLNGVFKLTLLLTVKAASLQVVDSHEDTSEIADFRQFLRGYLLSLRLKLVLLVFNGLKALLKLSNVVVKLHYLSLHVLLVVSNCCLKLL